MGYLVAGVPLPWAESEAAVKSVRHAGISQLIHLWRLNACRVDHAMKWGDEIEFILLQFDHKTMTTRVYADAEEVIQTLSAAEESTLGPDSPESRELAQIAASLTGLESTFMYRTEWHPECGRHMVEAVPMSPYELSVDSLLEVEASMISRRFKLQSVLPPNVFVSSLTTFPGLGIGDFMTSKARLALEDGDEVGLEKWRQEFFGQKSGKSSFLPKTILNRHPRFTTLVENTCSRRGDAQHMFAPLFQDQLTSEAPAFKDALDMETAERSKILTTEFTTPNPVKDHIFMDHFAFGFGMSCLQTTYGTPNLQTARYLYDQLAVLAPIFLALSAATPFHRGLISDWDTRWAVLEQCTDCRRDDEKSALKTTRFSPIQVFVSDDPSLTLNDAKYNDVDVAVDQPTYKRLLGAGMDPILARHFGHLWMRDPMAIYVEELDPQEMTSNCHFENIQSTNWNSVRLKVPPPGSNDGASPSTMPWRVEFRTPDVQLTDKENACLASIITLIAYAIMQNMSKFYIPMSKVHENFEEAKKRDPISTGRFWFRTNLDYDGENAEFVKMSIREIFCGAPQYNFIGLLPWLDQFVSSEWRSRKCSCKAVKKYRTYADLIRRRANGVDWTNADILRHVVRYHSEYNKDSILTPRAIYDICRMAVVRGFLPFAQLLPCLRINSLAFICPSIADLPLEHKVLKYLSELCCPGINANTIADTKATVEVQLVTSAPRKESNSEDSDQNYLHFTCRCTRLSDINPGSAQALTVESRPVCDESDRSSGLILERD